MGATRQFWSRMELVVSAGRADCRPDAVLTILPGVEAGVVESCHSLKYSGRRSTTGTGALSPAAGKSTGGRTGAPRAVIDLDAATA